MQHDPTIALVPLEHDLDVTTVDALRATVGRLVDGGCRRIILNMSGVSYVDSAGMALLISEVRHMRSLGGLISMTNVSSQVLRIFRRARLVDFAPISASRDAGATITPLDPATLPRWRRAISVDADDLSATRAQVGRLIDQTPLSPDDAFDANLAVGEAVGNAVDHTGGADATVTVAEYPDRVVVEVSDAGPGFDPEATDDEAAGESDPYAERGRGIRLMGLLADSVSICPREAGQGMSVRLVKLVRGTD